MSIVVNPDLWVKVSGYISIVVNPDQQSGLVRDPDKQFKVSHVSQSCSLFMMLLVAFLHCFVTDFFNE